MDSNAEPPVSNAQVNQFTSDTYPQPNASSIEQEKKSTLTEQEQELLKNFMQQPFQFAPPPLFLDESLRLYRDNVGKLIAPLTPYYDMFNQKYSIHTGQLIKPNAPSNSNEGASNSRPQEENKGRTLTIKMKVFNLKFVGYTLYACMIETLKNLKKQDTTAQKLKSCHSLMRKKIEQFYKQAYQLKEDYRRMQVVQLLEAEIEELKRETAYINGKLQGIEQYIDEEGDRNMAD